MPKSIRKYDKDAIWKDRITELQRYGDPATLASDLKSARELIEDICGGIDWMRLRVDVSADLMRRAKALGCEVDDAS
jgi:hypothetical protein